MKRIFFILILLFTSALFCEKQKGKTDAEILKESFGYVRTGPFTFLHVPIGGEVAVGYRFRSDRFEGGPMINVSGSPYAYPAISFKMEGYYYPLDWRGGYYGIMPGVGVGYIKTTFDTKYNRWDFFPSLEIVVGKEFVTENKKKRFYYVSISPLLSLSFNYGWAF